MRRRPPAMLALLLAACAAPPAHGARDLAGDRIELLHVPPRTVRVLVFTSHECPIANSYAPTLRGLVERTAGSPVEWYLVHVDPDLTAAAADEHARAFDLPLRVCLEPSQATARTLGVERTPEAAVLTAGGGVRYVGRIDDQWRGLGARRAHPDQHDLADAIDAAVAGRALAATRRPAVGCLLPEPARAP